MFRNNLEEAFMCKKEVFFRGCLPLIAAVSLLWAGCVNPTHPKGVSGGGTEEPTEFGTPIIQNIVTDDGALTVIWSPVEDAAKYELRYIEADNSDYIDGNGTSLIVNSNSAANSGKETHVINELVNGTEYTVKVRAGNGTDWGGWSGGANGTPKKPVPPNELETPVIDIEPGDGELTVTWDAVDGASKYEVVCIDSEGNEAGRMEVYGVIHTIKGLQNGKRYTVKVRAGNSLGWSDKWAEFTDAIPADPLKSDPPENLTVSAGDGTLTVAWDAVEGALSYRLEWLFETSSLGNQQTSNTTYTITGLNNGVTYTVEVRAGLGGAWSEPATVKGMPVAKATVPNAPAVDEVRHGTALGHLIVTWDPPAGAAKFKTAWNTT
jgi:hypothetical protein